MATALVTVRSMSSFKTLPHSPHTLQDIGALVAICAAGCSPVRGPSTGASIGPFTLPSTPGLAVVGCPEFAQEMRCKHLKSWALSRGFAPWGGFSGRLSSGVGVLSRIFI